MSDKVKALTDAFEKLQKEQEKLQESIKERREKHTELSKVAKNLHEEQEELKRKMFVVSNEIQNKSQELHHKEHEVANAQKAMETQIYEDKVKALTVKQPDFYDELERLYSERVVVSDSSLEGFSSLMEPSIFKEKMSHFADKGGFGGIALEIRSAKAAYEQRIRGLCEKNIRGEKISFAEREQRVAPIINLIRSPQCEVIWNGG